MRLVKFELKPNSKCPFMRLLVLLISLVSLVTPVRAAKPPRLPFGGASLCASAPTPVAVSRGCRSPLRALQPSTRSRCCPPSMIEEEGGGKAEKVLILGAGWVGSRLAKKLADEGAQVGVTNRPSTREGAKPPYFRPVNMPEGVKPRVLFEMNDKETWDNLPPASDYDAVVITFPLNSANCEDFFDEYLRGVPKLVCYSSTSVYQVHPQRQAGFLRPPLPHLSRPSSHSPLSPPFLPSPLAHALIANRTG